MKLNVYFVRYQKYITSIAFLIQSSYTLYAQSDSSTLVFTLPIVIETALQNYPAIKAKQAQRESYVEQVKVAKTAYIPRLMLQEQVTYATANSVTGSFFPNEGMAIPISGGINSNNNGIATYGQYTSLVLTGPIYTFGKIKSSINTKQAEYNEANALYQNELFQHKINVSEAYIYLLAVMKLEKAQEVNLERAKTLQRAIVAAARSGIRPGADSAYVNAEVAKSKLSLLEVQQKVASAKIHLAELMGLDNENFQIDTMMFYNRLPEDRIYATDIANNPMLQLYQSKINYGKARSIEIKKSYLPSVNYIGSGMARGSGFGYNDPTVNYSQNFGTGAGYKRYNYLVGVYVLWNILDYSKVHHTYKGNVNTTSQYQYEYDEQTLKLQGMVKNAQLEQRIAREKTVQATEQFNSAQSSYRQSLARYQSGLSILPELSQSLLLLNRAEADISIANYAVWRALLSMSASTGDFDLFINQIK